MKREMMPQIIAMRMLHQAGHLERADKNQPCTKVLRIQLPRKSVLMGLSKLSLQMLMLALITGYNQTSVIGRQIFGKIKYHRKLDSEKRSLSMIKLEGCTKEISLDFARQEKDSTDFVIMMDSLGRTYPRRLLHDDGRGVAESLDEEVCVSDQCAGLVIQGKFYILIDPLGEGAKWRRSAGQEIYSPLLLAFSEKDAGANWADSHRPTFSMADPSYSLPDNVALTTLQALEDGSTLLRLAHLYEVGEDQDLSVMARVDLDKLFSGRKISKITETNLSANQERVEMEKKRLKWQVEGSARSTGPVFADDGSGADSPRDNQDSSAKTDLCQDQQALFDELGSTNIKMAVTEKDAPSRLPIRETPPSMGEILSNMDPGTSFPSYEVEKFVGRHPSKQNGLHKQVK